MGLLDSLTSGSQGGYGGLLDMLMYKSPLLQQQEAAPGPQYDPMGMPFAAAPQSDSPGPFGPVPGLAQWAQQFAPKATQPFDVGAAPVSFAGPPQAAPQAPAPMPPQAPAAPQVNDIGVGGYQMPRIGSAADYTPQQMPTDVSAQSRQPQAQAPQSMPPALGGNPSAGVGDRLMASVNNFANAGGPLQAIAGGLSGLVTGNRTDAAGIAQQNLKAQYDSLVPMIGPQKAMLAVMNPEAGKLLLDQALGTKQKFTEIGVNADGTKQYGFVSERDQSVKPYAAPGSSDVSKGVAGPDGKIIPYPEGMDASARKAFANHIAATNADAATGKMTESQGKAAGFATRMENSLDTIKKFEDQGQSALGRMSEKAPFGGAYLQSPEYQRYTAAKQSFINAHLRKDSGASIHDPEFVRAEREFFPQPGEGAEVVREKAIRRAALAETTKREAGPGYKSSTPAALPSGWSVSVR